MIKMGEFCNSACETLHKLGVPLDRGEWLELAYLMRNVEDFNEISSSQKKDMQEMLIKIFRKKDYFPKEYKKAVNDIEEIRHNNCRERIDGLEEIIDSMSKVIAGMSNDVGDLASKQVHNIEGMKGTAEKISINIKENRPREETLALVDSLKKRCRVAFENIAEIQKTLIEDASFDPLTKLYNRRSFDTYLEKSIEKFRVDKIPLSLLLIDVDKFKAVNDNFGHLVGDQVLSAVSGEIRRNVRSADHAARYGGEELVIIMNDVSLDMAIEHANTIRECIEGHKFLIRASKKVITITVSIGVSECNADWLHLSDIEIKEKLIDAADKALYSAKEGGRNMVCVQNVVNG